MFLLTLLVDLLLLCVSQSNAVRADIENMLPECNKTTRGSRLLYNNRERNYLNVLCVKQNLKYLWRFTDGTSTYGERFNPAKDCSDVVDNLRSAQDGFYWVKTSERRKKKIWCDVYTDGGGFTLIGMKDSPVSWTVPSNSTPVDPQGPPHWSSDLGDIRMLDFRVQVSTDKTFTSTKAHWIYHLNSERELGNLFSDDPSTGCTRLHPGIGDVMYVKDVLTGSIATTNFKCSKFGPHSHPDLGWGRMNYCLRHRCEKGFAVIPGQDTPLDQFGSFSYSTVSRSSGIDGNSTAFIGCDFGKCCACYGPEGGRQNYCGPACTAINGGTVSKNAFVWFWVRTRMPKRLWKKCMEFTVTDHNGKLQKYFIDQRTGRAHKGTCSYQFNTLLNEGTLTVSDKESFEKIPDVPGLLSYRKVNKQLYVNEGSKWEALSSEKELQQLKDEQKFGLETVRREMKNKTFELKQLKDKVEHNDKTALEILELEIQDQRNKIESQERKIQAEEDKNDIQDEKIQNQDDKNQIQDDKIQNIERKFEQLKSSIEQFQAPDTCSELRQQNPALPSGIYYINPQRRPFKSVVVYCDMTSKNGSGVTLIGHDSELSTKVDGYEASGSYSRKINYDTSIEQIVAIIKRSQRCEQFTKYKCYNAGLWLGGPGPRAWWVSRDGTQMKYWGGAQAGSLKCVCGMTKSCVDPNRTCNCDQNNNIWTEDSGFLTDKNTLPVTELRFGDTGGTLGNGHNEIGYHTLGKLRCWG